MALDMIAASLINLETLPPTDVVAMPEMPQDSLFMAILASQLIPMGFQAAEPPVVVNDAAPLMLSTVELPVIAPTIEPPAFPLEPMAIDSELAETALPKPEFEQPKFDRPEPKEDVQTNLPVAPPQPSTAQPIGPTSHTVEVRIDPVQRSHLVEQAAIRIETMVRTGETDQARIQLNPPELGSISISLTVTGGEVHARLAADQEQTRQMLEQAAEQLRSALDQKGLSLKEFSVADQGTQQSQGEPAQSSESLQSIEWQVGAINLDGVFTTIV